jgi:alpha-amylase
VKLGRWTAVLAIVALGASVLPLAPTHGASAAAKKKCHYVTKKVHGKKTKVKVCTKVKKATPTPTPTATSSPPSLTPLAPAQLAHDVSVNLFEWSWPSVATECKTVLGPAGYGSVQVAPPEDSLAIPQYWYDVYQPADYNLTSRMGDEAQFKAMVATCRAAGVRVIVDAVINHTAGGGGTSYGGYSFTKYDHPGLFTSADYHYYPADCPNPDDQVHDYNDDFTEVTKCELLGLADLRTEAPNVRNTIAGYLNKMIDDGVSGFRVDAAKHIGEADLAAIESLLHKTADGQPPFMALEVMPGGSGQLAPAAFEPEGSLLGFDYADVLKIRFGTSIAGLQFLGVGTRWLPSDKVLVFVQNHDTERNGSTLSYRDGATNILATEFMLAWNYGTPQVYSSFTFNGTNDPPPTDAKGYVLATSCGPSWTCLDRNPGILNMVGWHNHVAGQAVANWYDDGSNLIAFSRGAKGWIAVNNGATPQTHTFATGLPAGSYCDVIHGNTASCAGNTVTVDAQGMASVTVPAKDAVAIQSP